MSKFKDIFEEKSSIYQELTNPLLPQPVSEVLCTKFGATHPVFVLPTINVVAEELHSIGLDLQEQIRNSDNPDSLNKEVASIFTDITSRRIHPDAEESKADELILSTAIGYGILAGLTDTEVFDEEESDQE
jgi:hypothetical protein